jgi:hypothetical protein
MRAAISFIVTRFLGYDPLTAASSGLIVPPVFIAAAYLGDWPESVYFSWLVGTATIAVSSVAYICVRLYCDFNESSRASRGCRTRLSGA